MTSSLTSNMIRSASRIQTQTGQTGSDIVVVHGTVYRDRREKRVDVAVRGPWTVGVVLRQSE